MATAAPKVSLKRKLRRNGDVDADADAADCRVPLTCLFMMHGNNTTPSSSSSSSSSLSSSTCNPLQERDEGDKEGERGGGDIDYLYFSVPFAVPAERFSCEGGDYPWTWDKERHSPDRLGNTTAKSGIGFRHT
jgi:hypothetical protein